MQERALRGQRQLGQHAVTEVDPHPLERGLAAPYDRADDVILLGDAESAVEHAEALELVGRLPVDRGRDPHANTALDEARDGGDHFLEVARAPQLVVAVGRVGVERDLERRVDAGQRLDAGEQPVREQGSVRERDRRQDPGQLDQRLG